MVFHAYHTPAKRWHAIEVIDYEGVTVKVVDAMTGKTAAYLSPKEYARSDIDLPHISWAHLSETLAVATKRGLWLWEPPLRQFEIAATWHWNDNRVPLAMISWSADDAWILREFSSGSTKKRLHRFECVRMSDRSVIPAEVSYPAITIAQWLDDEPAFTINVIVDEEREEYRTVHIDAVTGKVLREYS